MVFISEKVILLTISMQLSVAVAIPVLEKMPLATQFKVLLGGQVITGLEVSFTTMDCKQEFELLHESTAVQVLVIT